jgi:Short C-terminal domain
MGLLKTGLKAAVAVKTADVIHERVLARQQAHAAASGHPGPAVAVTQPAPATPIAAVATPATPVPAAPDMGNKLAQLKQLGDLRAAGVLTDTEFEVQKAQILSP